MYTVTPLKGRNCMQISGKWFCIFFRCMKFAVGLHLRSFLTSKNTIAFGSNVLHTSVILLVRTEIA